MSPAPSLPPTAELSPPRPAARTGGPYPVRAQIHMCPDRSVLRQPLPPPAHPAGRRRPSAPGRGGGSRPLPPGRPYLAARSRSRSGSSAKTRTSTESGRAGPAAIAAVATTNPDPAPARPGRGLGATGRPRWLRWARDLPANPLPYRQPLPVPPRCSALSPGVSSSLAHATCVSPSRVPCSVPLVPASPHLLSCHCPPNTPPPVPPLSWHCPPWCLLEERK